MHLCKFHIATNIPSHIVSSFPFFAYNIKLMYKKPFKEHEEFALGD